MAGQSGLSITVVLVLSLAIMFVSAGILPGVAKGATSSESVNFSVADSGNHLMATFVTTVVWDKDLKTTKGSLVDVSYTLSSASGTLSIMVPLSDLGVGLADRTVHISIPATPIGSVSLPLTDAIGVPLPSQIASIDLILQASIRVSKMECSAGSDRVETPLSDLQWVDWGTRTATVTADPGDSSGTVSIRTTFAYALSYGITVSVLGSTFRLIPMTTISAVNGSPTLLTSIQLSEGFPVLILVLTIAVIVVVLVAIAVLMRRRRT
jgi:hypothetical protein